MGEAKRRKAAGDTKRKGDKWKEFKPSKHYKYIAIGRNRLK